MDIFAQAALSKAKSNSAAIAALQASEELGKYKFISCALRNTDGTWSTISDSAHNSMGVLSVAADTSKIRINYDFTATKIHTLVCTPDESFAQRGITFGASVGTTYSDIYAGTPGRDIGGQIYYDGSAWQIFNGAIGISEVSFANGYLTITHDSCTDYLMQATPRDGGYTVKIGSYSATTTKIYFYNAAGTQITTPDTSMKFMFSKRGPAWKTIDPLTLTEVNYPASNIWVYGVFEIS
jgi:hypothetical protein